MRLYRCLRRPGDEGTIAQYDEATAQDLLAAAEAYLEAHGWKGVGESWINPTRRMTPVSTTTALRKQARGETT